MEQLQGREVSSRYHGELSLILVINACFIFSLSEITPTLDMQPPFELPRKAAEVPSGYVRQMSKGKLLIPGKSIQLQDCIGQGEPSHKEER